MQALPNIGILNEKHPHKKYMSAGHPSREQLQRALEKGVGCVINLCDACEFSDYDEQNVCRTYGAEFYNLPVKSPADMTSENVAALDQLLKNAGDKAVFVHCASGERVGALMALRAAWLEGKSRDEALLIGADWGLSKLASKVENILDNGT